MQKVTVTSLISLFFLFSACQSPEQKGEKLAKVYCASCHEFPEPTLLDKATWKNNVLPNMAARMGFGDPFFTLLGGTSNDELIRIAAAGAFFSQPIIDSTDLRLIVNYYLKNAPEHLPKATNSQLVSPILTQFEPEKIYLSRGEPPTVTYVGMQPNTHDLYVAEALGKMYRLRKGKKVEEIKINNTIADVDFSENDLHLLEMGIMNPNDAAKGTWSVWEKGKAMAIIEKLNRPVHTTRADLNADAKLDVVICEHGNYTGQLAWIPKTDKGFGQARVINAFAGARCTVIKDWNKDGHPDVLALMGQGREGIFAYLNNGKGSFVEKPLLQFPAVYGSSYFEVVDMNNDGFDDVVYTNGDNSDLSIIHKPYHGLRIFLNNGRGTLTEKYFYALNGASKVISEDFDKDGDRDLAVISYFPDLKKNERFLYFENNNKGLSFNISTFAEAPLGKWLVMCGGDVDTDGDTDIVLGSYPSLAFWEQPKGIKQLPSIIILKNKHLNKQ